MEKVSRIEIGKSEKHDGLYDIVIVCEKTKHVVPIYGLELIGAKNLAHLLINLGTWEMELPKKCIINEELAMQGGGK